MFQVVTMNSKLLGARLSFFQSVCVIGYCLMPLLLACILLRTLKLVYTHLAIRLIVVALAFAWSVYASVGFIGSNADDNRRALIIYPVFLFFLVSCVCEWMPFLFLLTLRNRRSLHG